MVKRVLFAFALGAWCLQQCANLPALTLCAGLAMPAVLSVAGLALACRWTGAHGYGPWPRLLLPCAILALALSAGFGWSAWRAERRLQLGLPHNLEQRDLIVSGVVRGLPESFDYGTRFVFQIIRYEPLVAPHGTVRQSRGAAGRDAPTAPAPALKLPPDLPQTVLLTWYLPSRPAQPTQPAGGPQARPLAARQPPELEAGQRWRLAVRLIRPHGNANEFGSDRERWMLERDLRASGTVQSNAPSELLGYARGWQLNALLDAVDRWRGRLRQRIETVLAGAAHAGVVVALATGAQAAISAQDWQRFTQTGTNHLVAISGLHVSLVAGLCAWLAGWFFVVAGTVCGGAGRGGGRGGLYRTGRLRRAGSTCLVDAVGGRAGVDQRAQYRCRNHLGLGLGLGGVDRSMGGGVARPCSVVQRCGCGIAGRKQSAPRGVAGLAQSLVE